MSSKVLPIHDIVRGVGYTIKLNHVAYDLWSLVVLDSLGESILSITTTAKTLQTLFSTVNYACGKQVAHERAVALCSLLDATFSTVFYENNQWQVDLHTKDETIRVQL